MYERHRARTYYCDLCGRSVTLLPERRGYGAPGYYLPEGWTGSHRRRGCCLCPECSKAVRTALRANEGDSGATSGDGTTERPDEGAAGARGAEDGPEGGGAGGR